MANASTYTATQLRNYAWMSQAAYLDLSDIKNEDLNGALTTEKRGSDISDLFADDQASLFTHTQTGYSLVSHRPDQSSGMSATVFKSSSNGGFTLAVRGTTQPFQDMIQADFLGVVIAGQAKQQLFDAYRYYKQITTASGATVIYNAAELNAMALLSTGKSNVAWLSGTNPLSADQGLGKVPTGTAVNFTGHSLGGHVAALLAQMVGNFQGKAAVGDVVTYNAPGLNALWNELANWMGINTSVQTGVLGEKHVAVIAQPGVNVAAGLGSTNGTKQMVFIEEGVLWQNHSMVRLSDALALGATLQTLDKAIGAKQTQAILFAGSRLAADSLESTLDALRQMVLGKVTGTKAAGSSDSVETRNSYYKNLSELQDSSTFKALAGKLTLSASKAAAEVAKKDFAQFLSLYELTPFSATVKEGAAQTALMNARSDVASKWQTLTDNFSDKWLQDRSAMQSWIMKANTKDTVGDITGEPLYLSGYFEDMASGKSVKVGTVTASQMRNFKFGDANDNALTGGTLNDALYGGDGNDTLNGMEKSDWLEGGKGFDTYMAGQGDVICDSDGKGAVNWVGKTLNGSTNHVSTNRWQGVAGETYTKFDNDIVIQMGTETITLKDAYQKACTESFLGIALRGELASAPLVQMEYTGSFLREVWEWRRLSGWGFKETTGTETFRMGDGDDQVASIAGGDQFYGELGNDIFIATEGNNYAEGGEGNDVLADGLLLDYILKEVYLPGSYTYVPFVGSIFTPGKLVTQWAVPNITRSVVNVENSDVSLHVMNGTLFRPIQTDDTLLGGSGDDWLWGSAGSDILNGDEGQDIAYGGSGSDDIKGGDSNDILSGDDLSLVLNGGDHASDVIEAGAGQDTVFGNGGDDILSGAQGDDAIWGDDEFTPLQFHGNDMIDAGEGNDSVYGGGGDDYIAGGDGDDVLAGSEGSDEIFGQSGNDLLNGDLPNPNDMLKGSHVYASSTGMNLSNLRQKIADVSTERYAADPAYLGGSDSLYGGDGNDTLIGGRGDDVLGGGSGSDTYVFASGDGFDLLIEDPKDMGSTDTLLLGEGLLMSLTSVFKQDQDLVLSWNDHDSLVIQDQFFRWHRPPLNGWFLQMEPCGITNG